MDFIKVEYLEDKIKPVWMMVWISNEPLTSENVQKLMDEAHWHYRYPITGNPRKRIVLCSKDASFNGGVYYKTVKILKDSVEK